MIRHFLFFIACIGAALSTVSGDTKKTPTQVEIVSVLEGLDLISSVGKSLVPKDAQAYQLPKVTTKSGKTAVIRVVREFPYPIDFNAENTPTSFDVSNLGVTLTIKPYIVNGEINFSGNLVLSTTPEKPDIKVESADIPTILTSKKVFTGKAKSGERVMIKSLSPSGDEVTLALTMLLMNQEGRPVD